VGVAITKQNQDLSLKERKVCGKCARVFSTRPVEERNARSTSKCNINPNRAENQQLAPHSDTLNFTTRPAKNRNMGRNAADTGMEKLRKNS